MPRLPLCAEDASPGHSCPHLLWTTASSAKGNAVRSAWGLHCFRLLLGCSLLYMEAPCDGQGAQAAWIDVGETDKATLARSCAHLDARKMDRPRRLS